MIVWEGRGGITALIIVASIGSVMASVNAMGLHVPDWQTYVAMAAIGAVANAILVANTPTVGRVVIDKETGKELVLSTRHTLFWIPIKYWTFIIIAYAVIGTVRDWPK